MKKRKNKTDVKLEARLNELTSEKFINPIKKKKNKCEIKRIQQEIEKRKKKKNQIKIVIGCVAVMGILLLFVNFKAFNERVDNPLNNIEVDTMDKTDQNMQIDVVDQIQENKEGEEKKEDEKKYELGEEVELGEVKFNIYKIDNKKKEIYLIAENNIATTQFSNDECEGVHVNSYEGSLVEKYVKEFVDDLKNKGVNVKSSGIIDEKDLYELACNKHSNSLSGLPYLCNENAPQFVKNGDNYWVGGYCQYQTRSWVYRSGSLDTQSCNDEYGVRPILIVDAEVVQIQQ